ncbi:RteC domain-containing protein [Chitinophaga sp. Ak27]|uniref:RteC domain-containing protein n=1 Tax=Chitinophaga sp. Ak27 TaxID=2726116 RepID=UPI00145CFACD|nr:RteC domain-containing protein [Chitinophaga sp. Ak27]NLU91388.1 tetracycline regulation of excision, RteC [Chitinophaga sp. Ak27]
MEIVNLIWKALREKLDLEQSTDQGTIACINRSISLTQTALSELKDLILKNGFKDPFEEINFFKNELPRFYALYLHFTRIHKIETRMPPGKENQLKILEKEVKRLAFYFEQNADWILYYRSGASHLDEHYFLRQTSNGLPTIFCPVVLDLRFTSYGTYPFSKIQSLELTQSYIDQKIAVLRNHPMRTDTNKPKTILRWTGSKSDLIELLYALHSSRLFNNDEYLDVRQIATWLETTLNIDLGNYYRVFQGIRIRKKNRTQFMDKLKENLIRRMDDTDENPRN